MGSLLYFFQNLRIRFINTRNISPSYFCLNSRLACYLKLVACLILLLSILFHYAPFCSKSNILPPNGVSFHIFPHPYGKCGLTLPYLWYWCLWSKIYKKQQSHFSFLTIKKSWYSQTIWPEEGSCSEVQYIILI